MNAEDIERMARGIAERAHSGQLDKAGAPYLGHVGRVARSLDDPLDRAVAWLYDVVEDTVWKVTDLRLQDIHLPPGDRHDWSTVCRDVALLTHVPGRPRSDYYADITASNRAVRVKLADIADNSDPSRLAELDDATRARLETKYAKAREALT